MNYPGVNQQQMKDFPHANKTVSGLALFCDNCLILFLKRDDIVENMYEEDYPEKIILLFMDHLLLLSLDSTTTTVQEDPMAEYQAVRRIQQEDGQ